MLNIPRITTMFTNITIVLNLLVFMEVFTYEDFSLDDNPVKKPWKFYTNIFMYKNYGSFNIFNFIQR